MLDAQVAEGVSLVFGMPGWHVLPIYDAILDEPAISSVLVRHEHQAAAMAAVHVQLTGRPAVVLVTAGLGVTNTVTAVAGAWVGPLPLVVLGGRASTVAAHRGASQEISTDDVFALITTWSVRVDRAEPVLDSRGPFPGRTPTTCRSTSSPPRSVAASGRTSSSSGMWAPWWSSCSASCRPDRPRCGGTSRAAPRGGPDSPSTSPRSRRTSLSRRVPRTAPCIRSGASGPRRRCSVPTPPWTVPPRRTGTGSPVVDVAVARERLPQTREQAPCPSPADLTRTTRRTHVRIPPPRRESGRRGPSGGRTRASRRATGDGARSRRAVRPRPRRGAVVLP
ncbi:hypothetical protein DMP14_10165 [Pseudonocardia sp. Ae707_Ps2]